jgi:hypothetical protein
VSRARTTSAGTIARIVIDPPANLAGAAAVPTDSDLIRPK